MKRASLVLTAFVLVSIGLAQIGRQQAEARVNGMSLYRSPSERAAMVRALSAPDPVLCEWISSGDAALAVVSAGEAGTRNRRIFEAPLIGVLSKSDAAETVQIAAIAALARMGSPRAVTGLRSACRSSRYAVRYEAAMALARKRDSTGVSVLREAVRRKDLQAAQELGWLGAKAATSDLRWLRDQAAARHGTDGRAICVAALARIGDRQGVADAKGLALHGTPETRRRAVEALGDLRDRRNGVVFTEALKDDSMNVRFAAVEALGKLGDRKFADLLRTFAKNPGPDAAQGPSGDRKGRCYARYIAGCLSSGTPCMSLRQFNLQASKLRYSGAKVGDDVLRP